MVSEISLGSILFAILWTSQASATEWKQCFRYFFPIFFFNVGLNGFEADSFPCHLKEHVRKSGKNMDREREGERVCAEACCQRTWDKSPGRTFVEIIELYVTSWKKRGIYLETSCLINRAKCSFIVLQGTSLGGERENSDTTRYVNLFICERE